MPSEEEHEEFEAALTKAAKDSHAAVEDAIRQHLTDCGVSGIATGWYLVAAVTDFAEGTELDGLYTTNSDGLSKWSRVGLLSVALKQEMEEDYL